MKLSVKKLPMMLLLPLLFLLGGFICCDAAVSVNPVGNCSVDERPTVQQALNELFTCLLETHLESSEIFRRAKTIDFHGIAGSGVTQAPLLTGVYSIAGILASAEAESYRRFLDVAGMFKVELGQDEVRGRDELAKLDSYMAFLERSPFIRDTFATLLANDALDEEATTLSQFVRVTLFNHWFKQYGRASKDHQRGLRDSSGFGHVFVGEVKAKEVTGFHNWLQLLKSEEARTFEYKGHVKVINGSLLVAGIQFSWLNRSKPLSSVVFGVPPEFELALYSACFIVNPGRKTQMSIKGKPVPVQTFYVNHQEESVATAYPTV